MNFLPSIWVISLLLRRLIPFSRIDLRLPAGVSGQLGSLLRRNLELAVACRVLADSVASSSTHSDAASELASSFTARSESAVAAMLSALRTPARPFLRSRSY
ncbi:hypothetical protein E7747_04585 [Duncaniella dubosii]|uniref:Uncharacterized protein n=1 Tax=Duncaniella dubosii TaxID=2518971 RepID=A0A4P7W174_9BACT|nr:hypothetical protein [Duncaniella dubosii]QCD41623.1 hypothetical protein E7747_04585 [Duncaniella dubosii]